MLSAKGQIVNSVCRVGHVVPILKAASVAPEPPQATCERRGTAVFQGDLMGRGPDLGHGP